MAEEPLVKPGNHLSVGLTDKKDCESLNIDPVFRVIRAGDWKKGIRLERQFWNVLKFAAQSQNKPIAVLIKDLLASTTDGNKTSYLRTYSLSWLYQVYRDLRSKISCEKIVKSLHAAPIPSLAITRNNRLYSYNAEFAALICDEALDLKAQGHAIHQAKFFLNVPLSKLFTVLEKDSHSSLMCEYKLSIGENIYNHRAKAVLVPSEKAEILMLYTVAYRNPDPN